MTEVPQYLRVISGADSPEAILHRAVFSILRDLTRCGSEFDVLARVARFGVSESSLPKLEAYASVAVAAVDAFDSMGWADIARRREEHRTVPGLARAIESHQERLAEETRTQVDRIAEIIGVAEWEELRAWVLEQRVPNMTFTDWSDFERLIEDRGGVEAFLDSLCESFGEGSDRV